jgi:hypothetical protein
MIKWYKIKLFRYIAHLFGIKFWRKSTIENVKEEAEKLFKYFDETINEK